MEESLKNLYLAVHKAIDSLRLNSIKKETLKLEARSQEKDFWEKPTEAQAVMKKIAKQTAIFRPWYELLDTINELVELSSLKDSSLSTEIEKQKVILEDRFNSMKSQLKLNGLYDNYDAIVSIYAGAGGTDAQDWAQILLRMYSRYCEKNKWECNLLEESVGESAGIKSVTLEVKGSFVYGKLKGEHGVHRLVRLSPFNADNLRQTSFAKVEVMPLIDKPEDLVVADKDLKIDVYRSGGHGGQSVNTTDSAVRITHLPTGIVVAIQNERSQLQNRETAMTIVRSKLASLGVEQHAEKLSEIRGPNQSAEWGNQIRNYVLHPYKQIKDMRSHYETTDPEAVLNGNLDELINAYLEHNLKS